MTMKEYKTISKVAGPLVFVEKTEPVGYGNLVKITLSNGDTRNGQVLDTSDNIVVVQVFEGTSGIDRNCKVKFLKETIKLPVSKDMLGRIFDGAGRPIDGGSQFISEKRLVKSGTAIHSY